MKKLLVVMVAVLLVVGLTGCVVSLNITINPNPLEFNSGEDIFDGDITVSVNGVGEINITRVTVLVVEAGTDKGLFSYDSNNDPAFQDQSLPFAVTGMSQTVKISEYLGNKTVNELLAEYGKELGLVEYQMVKGKTFTIKVELSGNISASAEAALIFN